MSGFAKVCAVFIPLGIVVSIAGGVLMFSSERPDLDDFGSYEVAESEIYTTYEIDGTQYDEENDLSDLNSFGRDEADAIVIDCTAAMINLYHSSERYYYIGSMDIEQDKLSATCTDRTINVKYAQKSITDSVDGNLDIGIPDTCKRVTIRCSAGDIQIDDFKGDDLDISVDCGNIGVSNARIQNSCKINSTLGNVEIYESTVNGLNADLVSGNIDIQNSILNNTNNINVKVGNCDAVLTGSAGDYTINAKVKVGEVDCDYDLSDFDYSDNKINISVVAGNCSIDFYD